MSVDSSEWPKYATIDPELAQLLSGMPQPTRFAEMPNMDVAKQAFKHLMQMLPAVDLSGVVKDTVSIPVRDGSTISAIRYRPEQSPSDGSPLAILFHGGGYCAGLPESEEENCVNLARSFGCVSLSIDYRLAPEHPHPVPIHDCIDAMKWAASNAASLGADPTKGFILGGESAGGNAVLVCSLVARDEKLTPPITGVHARIPLVVINSALPEQYKTECTSFPNGGDWPVLSAKDVDWFEQFWGATPQDPLASPLLWPTGHRDLPRTVFQIAGLDSLRDSGLVYERLLRQEGVPTLLHIYTGVPHGFDTVFGQISKSKQFREDRISDFGWLLNKEPKGNTKSET